MRLILILAAFSSLRVLSTPRVVSTSPQLTEILFQIGKQDSIVATTSFSDYPEEARKIPVIGPLFMPGLEATIRKTPDWVILDNSAPLYEYKSQLNRLTIPTLMVELKSVDALFLGAQKILKTVFGEETNSQLEAERRRWNALKQEKAKIKALILAWYDPFILVGRSTFLSDLLSHAGIENMAEDGWKLDYPQVSTEWVMKKRPDVVLYLQFGNDIPTDLQNAVKRVWPHIAPPIVTMESTLFPRASFTATRNLSLIQERLKNLKERRELER